MERHAALPELHDLRRMREEIGRVVEQHVADPAAEDDAERHPQDEVVEIDDGQRRLAAPEPFGADDGAGVDPAAENADDIGERIPADRERPDLDQHGIEGGEGEGEGRHVPGVADKCGGDAAVPQVKSRYRTRRVGLDTMTGDSDRSPRSLERAPAGHHAKRLRADGV